MEWAEQLSVAVHAARAAGDLLRMKFGQRFPNDALLGEESGAHAGGAGRWIVDPLDGTTNFFHGYPCFCVSIAFEFEGVVVVGVVYDPTRDELFVARRGAGARLNGGAISVSHRAQLRDGLLVTGFPPFGGG